MAVYEKTTATTANEDDLGRHVTFYDAKTTGGTTVARVTIDVPGAERFDGLVNDLYTLAADRTSLRALLVKGVRKVLTDQGMTVKP